MTYVEDFKKNLHCCIVKKTNKLIELQQSLIKNTTLENEIKILNLFSYALEDVDCNDLISPEIKSKILSICDVDCFNCNNDIERIIIEEWFPDISDYSTHWIEFEFECTKDLNHIWIPFVECCQQVTE